MSSQMQVSHVLAFSLSSIVISVPDPLLFLYFSCTDFFMLCKDSHTRSNKTETISIPYIYDMHNCLIVCFVSIFCQRDMPWSQQSLWGKMTYGGGKSFTKSKHSPRVFEINQSTVSVQVKKPWLSGQAITPQINSFISLFLCLANCAWNWRLCCCSF